MHLGVGIMYTRSLSLHMQHNILEYPLGERLSMSKHAEILSFRCKLLRRMVLHYIGRSCCVILPAILVALRDPHMHS